MSGPVDEPDELATIVDRIDALLGWEPLDLWWHAASKLTRAGHSLGAVLTASGVARRQGSAPDAVSGLDAGGAGQE